MLHLVNTGYLPKDANSLLYQARELSQGLNVTVRDTRVSSKYVEFDISINKDSEPEKIVVFSIFDGIKWHSVHSKSIINRNFLSPFIWEHNF